MDKNVALASTSYERSDSHEEKEDGGISGLGDLLGDYQSRLNNITCMLARYAEYANMGGDRSDGFGVTRLR